MRIRPDHVRWILLALLLLLWELLPRAGLIPSLFLPALSETMAAGLAEWRTFAVHTWATLGEVALAVGVSCGGGLILGAMLGSEPRLRRLFLPMVSSIYAIPMVILYPLLTVWFGIGPESKILFGAFYGLIPTLLATAVAIQTVPENYLIVADSMGATATQRAWRVILPASIPIVLTGIRLGGALAIVGVVVAEMLVSTAGLGYLISLYRLKLATPHVFFAIFLVLVLTLLFDSLVRALERATASWRPVSNEAAAHPVL